MLTNGESFYEAELDAIRAAQRFVHLECYIFQQGRVTDRFLQALEERARAGVEVRLVVDAIGSAAFPDSRFKLLRQAGGRAAWYHPVRWYTWPRLNNRTHREILVVDGTVAFAGGAGFADQWLYNEGDDRRWRDTMVRIEGEAAGGARRGLLAKTGSKRPARCWCIPRLLPVPTLGREDEGAGGHQFSHYRPLHGSAPPGSKPGGEGGPKRPHHHPLLPAGQEPPRGTGEGGARARM